MRTREEILAYNRGQRDASDALRHFAAEWRGRDGQQALLYFADIIRESAEDSDREEARK